MTTTVPRKELIGDIQVSFPLNLYIKGKRLAMIVHDFMSCCFYVYKVDIAHVTVILHLSYASKYKFDVILHVAGVGYPNGTVLIITNTSTPTNSTAVTLAQIATI